MLLFFPVFWTNIALHPACTGFTVAVHMPFESALFSAITAFFATWSSCTSPSDTCCNETRFQSDRGKLGEVSFSRFFAHTYLLQDGRGNTYVRR